jgi:hypothetical protein
MASLYENKKIPGSHPREMQKKPTIIFLYKTSLGISKGQERQQL